MPFSELFTAAVAAAAVAVTEAGAVAGIWATGCDGACSLATGAGAGAACDVEVEGMLLFSDMMPRNGSCRVWRNRLGTTIQEERGEQHTINLTGHRSVSRVTLSDIEGFVSGQRVVNITREMTEEEEEG